MIQAFDELLDVDDRSLQEWLGSTNVTLLCMAMHGTSDDVRVKIRRNLSSLGRQALQAEMETIVDLTPVRIERSKELLVRGLSDFLEQREERIGGPGPSPGLAPVLSLKELAPKSLIVFFTEASRKVRRFGLVSLENDLPHIDDEFVREGIRLVAANVNPDLIRDVLQTRLAVMEADHRRATRHLREALEQDLNSDDEDKSDGANESGKADEEVLLQQLRAEDTWLDEIVSAYEMVMEGSLSVQAFENPVAIRLKLESFIIAGGESV